jgi:hypothetical protein
MLMGSVSQQQPWITLFNGKNLSGWEVRNGEAEYYVENGVLVGVSTLNTPNTFLCTIQDYGDFILEFEVRIDTSLNSGVQFRSNSLADYQDGRVHGYQAEIDPSQRSWSGGIYDEGRRGWLYDLSNHPEGQFAFKKNEWNHYRIEAIGSRLLVWVNGINTANLEDDMTESGFIALQVHSIDKQQKAGKMIQWKNIRILTEEPRKYSMMNQATAPLINTKNQ